MSLIQKSNEFLQAVKQTKEFLQLKEAKAKIDANKELKSKFNEFTKKQMQLYKAKSKEEAESIIAELNKNYKNLSAIPEMDRFIKASKQFNEMMAKVYKKINDAIESELS